MRSMDSRPSCDSPRRTASAAVGARRKRRQSTRSTWRRVVQLSIMHETRSFHSSCHKISSRRPNGDNGGAHQCRTGSGPLPGDDGGDAGARAGVSSFGALSAVTTIPRGSSSSRGVSSSFARGSGARRRGVRVSSTPPAMRLKLRRTGVVPDLPSVSSSHSAARKSSVWSFNPSSLTRASRTPFPP